jgi:predicted dehydrogenase
LYFSVSKATVFQSLLQSVQYNVDGMRIGVLGLGFMGSMHLKALHSIPRAELAAIYSSDPKKLSGDLSGIQGNLGGPGERFDFSRVKKYSQIESLLADPDIDALDICVPTDMHAPLALEALKAGKHVLVEKPMALDGSTAQQMITEARNRNRVLMTAHVLRFFPMYQALRGAVKDRNLGAVRWAMFRRRCAAPEWSTWLKDPNRSGGGVFDLLIHDVDMCLHLFGKPKMVSATGYEALDRGIDLMMAELHYPGQGTAFVTGGWHHPKSYPFSMEYTVVTDGGTLEYSSLGQPPVLCRASGVHESLPMTDNDGYAAEIEYFVECCRANKQPELCPPHESADAVALMHLLLEARNKNGENIECNL